MLHFFLKTKNKFKLAIKGTCVHKEVNKIDSEDVKKRKQQRCQQAARRIRQCQWATELFHLVFIFVLFFLVHRIEIPISAEI